MQIATVTATDGDHNYNRTKCRLFLDSGNQPSFIIRSLASITDSKSIRTDYLTIARFGTLIPECLPRELVDITISDKGHKENV